MVDLQLTAGAIDSPSHTQPRRGLLPRTGCTRGAECGLLGNPRMPCCLRKSTLEAFEMANQIGPRSYRKQIALKPKRSQQLSA